LTLDARTSIQKRLHRISARAGETIHKREIAVLSATNTLWLGTAGWNVPTACRERVGGKGSHLQRYAQTMNASEINTSFHRPHRRTTYERWARDTPDDFRFAVKVPKAATHVTGLALPEIERFVNESAGLGEKLAVFLLQFPPGKSFDRQDADALFDALRLRSPAVLVCEPRHASWFTPKVDDWLAQRRVSRVAADPARTEDADQPGGWKGMRYFRLHGSPRIYYSSYEESALRVLKDQLIKSVGAAETWCIFDNTASGAAMENALSVMDSLLRSDPIPLTGQR
jgi:uncharacterized protein YecE (DUF72 family)